MPCRHAVCRMQPAAHREPPRRRLGIDDVVGDDEYEIATAAETQEGAPVLADGIEGRQVREAWAGQEVRGTEG